jgi:hypothetical protein
MLARRTLLAAPTLLPLPALAQDWRPDRPLRFLDPAEDLNELKALWDQHPWRE